MNNWKVLIFEYFENNMVIFLSVYNKNIKKHAKRSEC